MEQNISEFQKWRRVSIFTAKAEKIDTAKRSKKRYRPACKMLRTAERKVTRKLQHKVRAADKKTIVLPESEDRRTYEAAAQILKEDLANLIIIGSEEAVKKGSEGLDVSKATIVDPEKNEKTQAYVDKLVELRAKKGMTPEKARETILNDYTYYGCLLYTSPSPRDA